jgi:hypothetical protein
MLDAQSRLTYREFCYHALNNSWRRVFLPAASLSFPFCRVRASII